MVARRRQSVLRDVLVEMRDRLRPGVFRPDMRGELLLVEVQAMEASGRLVPLDGALVGDASEIGAVLRDHGVWPAAVADAFRRAGWEPIIHRPAAHD